MRLRADSERVTVSLREAVTLLCKTGFNFSTQLHIDGLLGITLDDDQVHLVKIQEVIKAVVSDNCDDRSTETATPESMIALDEQTNEAVMDLCVKSVPSAQGEANACRTPEEQHKTTVEEVNGSANGEDSSMDDEEKPLTIHIENQETMADPSEHSQSQMTTNAADNANTTKTETLESQATKPKRRRSRKGKATRHIVRSSVEDHSAFSDPESPPPESMAPASQPFSSTVDSTLSQEAVYSNSSGVFAVADEHSCDSLENNGPVNLTQSRDHASRDTTPTDAIFVKDEPTLNESQNILNMAASMVAGNLVTNLNANAISDPLNQMNFLKSVTISAQPLAGAGGVPNASAFNEQEMHAQWLQNIAQVVQNTTHTNPLVIAPQAAVEAANTPQGTTASKKANTKGKGPIPIAPAPAGSASKAQPLGMHRYSPYVVPPVMGPMSNAIVLNTPSLGKIKSSQQKATVPVVNNSNAASHRPNKNSNNSATATHVPTSPMCLASSPSHRHASIVAPDNPSPSHLDSQPPVAAYFACANCGTTKTTTWRRDANGEHVCNPCGLYYRMYKSSPNRSGRSAPRNSNPKADSSSSSSAKSNTTHICTNCGTLVTTMWRRNAEGEPVCNACGLYYKLHQVNRPLHMAKTEIHSRRRKPKSPLVTLPGGGGGGGGDFIGGSQHGDFNYMSSANPIDLSHLSEVETSSAEGGGGGGGSGDQEADLMATGEVVQDVGL